MLLILSNISHKMETKYASYSLKIRNCINVKFTAYEVEYKFRDQCYEEIWTMINCMISIVTETTSETSVCLVN